MDGEAVELSSPAVPRTCTNYGNAVVLHSMQPVVETPPYLADAERLFSEDERAAIIDTISADPQCGVVIPGTVFANCALRLADAASAAALG